MVLLLGIAAAAVVAVLAYWLARASGQRQLAEQRAAFAADLATARRDNEWLTGQIERERQALGSMREAFQSLAADALTNNRGAFLDALESRHKAFNEIVQPIAEALQKVDVKLADADRERLEAYARLTEKVSALGSTADTLSRALRTPAVRGRWGEMQLRRVVEIAGMLRRCDFDEQPALAGDNGRLRPDLVVHLPGGKQVVVDAKTPLEAFLDAQEAADEETRTIKLQAHARQVRDHMDRLGSKAYWEALASAPEFVVMFLPGETLFSAALQNDLGLIEHGLSQRVLLASPITLIALLTTVAHSWRQEALTENFREVAALGRELYDRLATFAGHLNEVRKRLDGAVQSYNQAAGSFEGRVLVTARRLKDLKVTTAEELPPAESIDTVPRVLKQMGLMGLPDGATAEDVEPV
ncbi:MAG TPA: DNA recombination protein RmuC [Vicinamibacterales bacterium]|nr:DNA recombination protein RmuC [Vicinamibacterales bacterium]